MNNTPVTYPLFEIEFERPVDVHCHECEPLNSLWQALYGIFHLVQNRVVYQSAQKPDFGVGICANIRQNEGNDAS